jgi:hypothetical protein
MCLFDDSVHCLASAVIYSKQKHCLLRNELKRLWVEAVMANLYRLGALKQTAERQRSRYRPTFQPRTMHIHSRVPLCRPTSVKIKKKFSFTSWRHMGDGRLRPPILKVGISWRWAVSFTLRLPYTCKGVTGIHWNPLNLMQSGPQRMTSLVPLGICISVLR